MRSVKVGLFAAVILVVNIVGIVWIHYDLTHAYKPQFRVLSAWPENAVQQADRLTLVLNEPLGSDRVGQPLDRPPFAVHPAASGQWQWGAADKLVYLLDKPLLPGRTYLLKASSDLEAQMGRELVGQREFVFQTDPLRITSCRLGTCEPQAVHIALAFNQPVSPDDLMHNLVISDAADNPAASRRKLDAACLTNQVGQSFIIRCDRPTSQLIRVLINGRMTGFHAELPLGADFQHSMKIATRFAMAGTEVEAPRLEKDLSVYLRFTNPLDMAQTLPVVTVDPKVEGLKVSREKDRLVLQGRFVCGKRYTAVVGPTLMSIDKQTLKDNSTATFDIPDRQPSLNIPASRGLLMPEGNLVLDIEAVNIPSIQIGASRLHANNLVSHVQGHHSDDTSRAIKKQSVKLDLVRNTPQTLSLDLRKVLGEPLGVYQLSMNSGLDRWDNHTAIITVTDLGLTAKHHLEGFTVWVTSLRTGKPLDNVKVSAITRNNQVIATTSTDADGLAKLVVPAKHPDGPALLIAAENNNDLSYLELDDRWNDEEYLGNNGRPIPTTYDMVLYCERGVYRPGETIHISGILRDAMGRIPRPMPLSLHVDRPDGKRVATLPVAPDSTGQGIFHADYQPAEDAQMGTYRLRVTLPGDKHVLGDCQVLVEAFVPVRMEVKARTTKQRYCPRERPEVLGSSRYLFGQPAVDLPTQIRGYYRSVRFESPKFADFVFDSDVGEKKDGQPIAQVQTDSNGQFKVLLDAPAEPKRLWKGSFVATVTEPGGRSVSSNFTFHVDTMAHHVGLRLPPSSIIPVQSDANVDWVLVDASGVEASGGPLEWTLERVEWDYVVELVNDRPAWKNQQRLIPAGRGALEGGSSSGSFVISCADAGQFHISIKDANSQTLTSRDFYASRGSDVGTNVSKPEHLEIVLDRKSYVPGSSAKVLIRSPFAGHLLLTMETDHLVDLRVLEMAGQQFEVDMPVPSDLRGGAFIAASVVRAVDPEKQKWMPHRAMGMARLETDHSAANLPVTIDAPGKIEPGRQVQVVVRTDKPIDPAQPGMIHLWAVDEGILLTTGFRTPNPHRFFFMPRQLGVDTFDLYGLLLPDYQRPAGVTRIGGDGGDEEIALRRSPVPTRVKQSTIIWNKSVPVDANGQVSASLDVPKFTGELRLMAVAVDHDRYGSKDKPLTVAAPLQAESSWPRFAAPGDRFKVPVKFFNTTGQPMTVSVEMMYQGPLSLSETPPATQPASRPATQIATTSSPATASSQAAAEATRETAAAPTQSKLSLSAIAVPAGASKTVWVYATATDLGQVEVSLSAKTDAAGRATPAFQAGDEARFTVRPVVPLTAQSKLIKFDAGTPQKIEPPGDYLLGRTTISLSGRPNVQLRPAIEQLIDYPYGCVEQTTSRLYAILYAGNLLDMEGAGEQRTALVTDMIDAGIARLWSMQTRDGGLGYWPGDTHSDLWGTAYAASFLVRARKAGFTVNTRFTDSLTDYIDKALKQTDASEADDNLRALLCNVLATFGRPAQGWMNRLADNLNKLDIAGRANLASAWLETGKKDRAAAMLSEDTLRINVGFSAGGRITSSVSQQAVLLDTLLDLDLSHTWVPMLVSRLEEARKRSGGWGSTHDNAMCLAALARYQTLSKDPPSEFKGTLRLAGQAAMDFDHAKPFIARTNRPNEPMEITTTGSGTVYAVVTTEGVERGKTFQSYDRRLEVRRVWKDAHGNAVDPSRMYVGQLVQVEVTIRLPGEANAESLDNIAIVDALPGGLEVENPQLKTSGGNDQSILPDRVQFMDDRVIMFCSAMKGHPQTYVYHLRVITAGRFDRPPIQASCMYDPEIASINGGGMIDVSDAMPQPTSPPASRPAATTRPGSSIEVLSPTAPALWAKVATDSR